MVCGTDEDPRREPLDDPQIQYPPRGTHRMQSAPVALTEARGQSLPGPGRPPQPQPVAAVGRMRHRPLLGDNPADREAPTP
jgi:hypothetical protein